MLLVLAFIIDSLVIIFYQLQRFDDFFDLNIPIDKP